MPQVVALKHIVFVFIGLLCFTPLFSAPAALLLGIGMAFIGFVPQHINLHGLIKRLLACAIVGMGFGVNLTTALASSWANLPLLISSIVITLGLAQLGTRLLRVNPITGTLIGAGTAICGGSAIAAVAPTIQARGEQIGVALGCVALLNAAALWIFPWVGHSLQLSSEQFGLWAALAIHDTSSVVAVAELYSDEALELATTLKLTRALAIIPLALLMAWWSTRSQALKTPEHSHQQEQRIKKRPQVPLFIILYLVAMIIAQLVPQGAVIYSGIFSVAKSTLSVCLFLIGATLSFATLKTAGIRPLVLAISVWLFISVGTLSWIVWA